ncbi:MAG: hypothetical protein ABFS24_06160 [Pseudomonadota bacterium]
MTSRREYVSGSVVLSLLLVTVPALADESVPNSEFTYTDDWAVVSAPPPPGPYRAVNIDPRVPGVDAIPPLSMDEVTTPARKDIPAEALANAPAAGIPASRLPQDSPASAVESHSSAQTVTPARAGNVPPSPSRYYYPAPPRYPAQTLSAPPSGYPAYRNQRNYGYGSPTYRQGQQQVPPPPMYDSIIRNQQPYGHPSGKGTP